MTDQNACTELFWKCANSYTFEYKCPSGLFYDVQTSRCDYGEFIPACGGQPTTTAPITTIQAVSTFDCTGKNNGFYQKSPCTSTFYSCVGGNLLTLLLIDF